MKINTADWKNEKHVPVIELAKTSNELKINVEVGKEIPHPNTYEHHIKWIEAYFEDAAGNLFPIGRVDFEGHGEKGFAKPSAQFIFQLKEHEKGKIVALSFCNIHGVWKSEKEV